MFQPSPGPKAGRYEIRFWSQQARRRCFNPRPARRPGATLDPTTATAKWVTFQPPPGPKAGRDTYIGGLLEGQITMFQPPPGPKAGRHLVTSVAQVKAMPFQPSPGPKAGRIENTRFKPGHQRRSPLAAWRTGREPSLGSH